MLVGGNIGRGACATGGVKLVCKNRNAQGAKWWRELQGVAAEYRSLFDEHCQLFSTMLPAIAEEQDAVREMRTDDSWPERMFEEMCTGRTVQSKGPRMALCRWMSWFDSVKYWWKSHTMRLCLFMMWGIRMGRLDASQESTQLGIR